MLEIRHASAKKKDKIYAAVFDGNGQQRSMLWRFTAKGDDLYGGGPAMGQQKLSLHASRRCRFANDVSTSEGVDRAFVKWTRPESGDYGHPVFRLVFPGSSLRVPTPPETASPLLLRMPCPGLGQATSLTMLYSRLPPDRFEVPPEISRDYSAIRLTGGEWVYFVPHLHGFDETQVVVPKEILSLRVPQPTAVYAHLFTQANSAGVATVFEMGGITIGE